MKFDLWDVETNKYLGHYDDESEALVLVRTLVDSYGPAYADDLELGAVTAEGQALEPLSGAALIDRAKEVLSRRQTDPKPRVGNGSTDPRHRSTSEDTLVAATTGPRQRPGGARARNRHKH